MVAPALAEGVGIVALLLVAAPAPALTPPAGVETVWAPAVPAAATRAIVNRVRFMGVVLILWYSPARRDAERTFRSRILALPVFRHRRSVGPTNRGNAWHTTTSSWAAAPP